MNTLKCICLIVLLFPLDGMCEGETKDSILTIKGSLIPSGPYEGVWRFKIDEFSDLGGAKVEFSRNVGPGGTTITGTGGFINYKSIVLLKSIIEDQAYFELPDSIYPDAISFHSLDYRLEICRVNKCHKVNLYDPDSLSESKEMKRFIQVWNAVMKTMPEWPSNWPLYKSKEAK